MKNTLIKSLSAFIVMAGLGLMTIAPYGGCSCNNPAGPSSGPGTSGAVATATPTPGPVLDNWEDGDLFNGWGGAVVTSIDTIGSTWSFAPGVSSGGSTLPGGTPGSCIRMAGTIWNPVANPSPPPATLYPYCAMVFGLGAQRDFLTNYNSYNCIGFFAKSGVAGRQYKMRIISPIVTDFGYYAFQFAPSPVNTWVYYKAFFPRLGQSVTGGLAPVAPEPDVTNVGANTNFAQPSWAVGKPWVTAGTGVKTKIDSIDFIVIEGGAPQAFDLSIDDLTFLPDTM